LELAAEEVQDEWLGFHLARSFDLREIGLVYYVIASSEQLADALRNAERYSQIINEGVRLRFRMQDGSAVIALDYVNVDRHADRHHIVLAGDAGAHLPTGDERPFVAFTAEDKTPPKWDACRNQNILRRRHRIWR
jgi:Arabinose-binding domain of AraC transcription regulator, N-term